MDSESASTSTNTWMSAPAKRVYKKSEFKEEWLQQPEFTLWLKKCEDIHKAKCKFCQKVITAKRGSLIDHKKSKGHIQNEESIRDMIIEEADSDVETACNNYEEMARRAELRLCVDIIEHNRSFNSFNHYADLLKKCFPDSRIVKHVRLSKTKIDAIITNVLNKMVEKKHTEVLSRKFFSIMVDKSTDLSNDKNLCFLIRYFDEGMIKTYLLDYMKISESTAENLFKCLIYSLQKNKLNIKNVVGVCANNANGMLGKHNSFASKILATNDEIAIIPCTCHCIHLVAHNATKCLPNESIEIVHKISTYFSRSSKRQAMLQDMQKICNIVQKRIIQPTPTRWLALANSVNIILKQWSGLIDFFAEAKLSENTQLVSYIFNTMNNKFTKPYLQFLNFVLPIMNQFNVLFQSNDVLIHKLWSESTRLLKYLADLFLTQKSITTVRDLKTLDIKNNDNLLPLEEIHTDLESKETLQAMRETNEASEDEVKQFYKNLQKFYQTAFEGVIARLPFDDKFVDALEFLDPKITLHMNMHKSQLKHILHKFPSKFDSQIVHTEWHQIPSYFEPHEKSEIVKLKVCDFWKKISEIKNPINEYRFPNIAKLAELCLTIPHSNAEIERFFSMINDIKTDKRNRLQCQSMKSLTRVKLDTSAEGKTCISWKAPEEASQLFRSQMYVRETIPEHLAGIILSDEDAEIETDSTYNRYR
nr:uncharacterized protein LOC117218532 [Megalopta genalis]